MFRSSGNRAKPSGSVDYHLVLSLMTSRFVNKGIFEKGDIEIAKQMVKMVKDCGVDCVKFQKCKPHEKFTRKALERPYNRFFIHDTDFFKSIS